MAQTVTKQPPSSTIEKLVGQRIVRIYRLTKAEMEEAGWYFPPVVIELQDGTALVPMSDEEGNNGGALMVQPKRGKQDVL